MAMFEKLGYCPNRALRRDLLTTRRRTFGSEANLTTKEVLKEMGDRIEYMVYDSSTITPDDYPYIEPLILHQNGGMIGSFLARKLTEYIPECKLGKTGKKILIRDVTFPDQIPSNAILSKNNFFCVGIENTLDSVNIWIFSTESYLDTD